MRARMALHVSGTPVALREVVLREKPDAFLKASQSGTVPCLVLADQVVDESLDIMIWALQQSDPNGWLRMPDGGWDLVTECDGPFKNALDRTKYATRYPDENPDEHREKACAFLQKLDSQLNDYLFAQPTIADFAILPFVRQFAFIDKPWFDAQAWPSLHSWLEAFLSSPEFNATMLKYPQWQPGDDPTVFPGA